jgi:acetyl esterase
VTSKVELDPRIDPRIKAFFAGIDLGTVRPNVSSREELLAQESTPAALAAQDRVNALFNAMDNEDLAPSGGLTVRTETFTSSPDGNIVNIQYIRSDGTRSCRASITSMAAGCSSAPAISATTRRGAG